MTDLLMKLDDALSGVTRLGLDTPVIIYFIEANLRYDAIVTEIFRRIDRGQITGVTSTISLTEVLVQPYLSGDIPLQQSYRDLLLGSDGLQVTAIDPIIAEHTAKLRARYSIRTPDALQIAVAINAGCEAFLTNDKMLKRVSELRVLMLDELEL
jgi:predicted nucleic acid-binding protein